MYMQSIDKIWNHCIKVIQKKKSQWASLEKKFQILYTIYQYNLFDHNIDFSSLLLNLAQVDFGSTWLI